MKVYVDVKMKKNTFLKYLLLVNLVGLCYRNYSYVIYIKFGNNSHIELILIE